MVVRIWAAAAFETELGQLPRDRALPLPEGPARDLQAQHMRKLLETRNGSPHTQTSQDHR